MSPESVQALNALNAAFYATVAADFNATRERAWAGWVQLFGMLGRLPHQMPLRVWDVGCGNGRFGVFLAEQWPAPVRYHGTDNSPALLDYAKHALAAWPTTRASFNPYDLLAPTHLQHSPPQTAASSPSSHTYDLVALFGVLHHIPGAHHRHNLLRRLARRVAPGGLLVLTCWRFMDNPRLAARVMDWNPAFEREPGDYLLDWRRGAHATRYCHHVDDHELQHLIAATGLVEQARFAADGDDNKTNLYVVLRRGE
ncbi:MAG: class I SAM-dependent methyltransferase [Phototrophicaceae bacterium]